MYCIVLGVVCSASSVHMFPSDFQKYELIRGILRGGGSAGVELIFFTGAGVGQCLDLC